MINYKNKNLLLIGGTGSFGVAFLRHLLQHHSEVNQVVIFSRDEQKQYELIASLNTYEKKKVRLFIGDVRDKARLETVMSNMDLVVYAAAMKHVPITEENPEECFKTNVQGTQNVIEVALKYKVEKLVALSTDKAVMPINSYGASKLMLEKLVIHANKNPLNQGTKLCVVRYANVLGSRGSVVPYFLKLKTTGTLPITDVNMTRFSITMQQGIDLVELALQNSEGGEIYVPKAPSYKITTVAEAIAPECKQKIVGIRTGEKLSELMVSRFEGVRTIEKENYYIVLPEEGMENIKGMAEKIKGSLVPSGFEYDSATNLYWLTAEAIKNQIADI
ncbi:MAG: SDR family NAD(P)-dependent oxidoreductase [Bacteroidetes bacterium]|nr:SDR family NAD(P)-dependent oxidoreductase [Bacteroidota bacterium]